MTDVRIPVLVVGGGGAGLTASMLLSTYGVGHVLVSSLPSTSTLPKAHVLQQRSMEVLSDLGCADEIYRTGTPARNMSHTAWYLDLAGSDHAGRLIHKMECWDVGGTDPAWVAASPCRQANLPQIRLEPVLRRRAEELNPGGIRFHHEVVAVEQDTDGVTATVVDRTSGCVQTVRCDYLVAADGGRTVGKLLGVEMQGDRDLMRTATVHLSADLSPWLRDPEVLIRWLVQPGHGGALSVLVPMGPDHWGPESEEWVFHMNYPPQDEAQFDTDDKVVDALRDRLGLPDLDPKIHRITRWSVEGLVASRTHVGRVFLIGDAAHRHPPTGGLGLNSAIHDAHNLSWKLAHVLQGKAGQGLLATYDEERRPSFTRNVRRSVENAMNHLAVMDALGVRPDLDDATCRANVLEWWEEGPAGDARRAAARGPLASSSMEFDEHNVEYGFRAVSPAVIADGSPAPVTEDDVRIYRPDTRPGSPLPHAFVERGGEKRALRDVAPASHWMLVAGEDGEAWCAGARQAAAARGLALTAVRVGHADGDWLDPRLGFVRVREIGKAGALLVRPDRVVAWRSLAAAEPDARGVLETVLDRVLMTAEG